MCLKASSPITAPQVWSSLLPWHRHHQTGGWMLWSSQSFLQWPDVGLESVSKASPQHFCETLLTNISVWTFIEATIPLFLPDMWWSGLCAAWVRSAAQVRLCCNYHADRSETWDTGNLKMSHRGGWHFGETLGKIKGPVQPNDKSHIFPLGLLRAVSSCADRLGFICPGFLLPVYTSKKSNV